MSSEAINSSNGGFNVRLIRAVKGAIRPSLRTGWWMVRLTVVVSLVVTLLQYYGVVGWMSQWLTPIFSHIGLPGEAALVYITGYFVNLYSAIAVIATLDFSVRAITILAVMCLCSHNMFVETAVQKKTGSSAIRIVILRTFSAFFLAFMLNLIMPENSTIRAAQEQVQTNVELPALLGAWVISTLKLVAKMMLLITSLTILQRILNEFGIVKLISKVLKPIMRIFGLPLQTSFLWIVANILGLAYGAAVMIEESEAGKISREDADLLNHHIAISHSNFEDLILLISVGALGLWMLISRWIMAIILVWLRRLELALRKRVSNTT